MKQDNGNFISMVVIVGLFTVIILVGAMCSYTTIMQMVLSNSTAITLQDRSLQSEDLKTNTFSITDGSFDCKLVPNVCLEAYKSFAQKKPSEAQVTIAPIKITVDSKETSTTTPVTIQKFSSLEEERVAVCTTAFKAEITSLKYWSSPERLENNWVCKQKTDDLISTGKSTSEIVDALIALKSVLNGGN